HQPDDRRHGACREPLRPPHPPRPATNSPRGNAAVAIDTKVEHLKFIQAAIARMSTDSFLLKGWTVTLVAALFAFGAKEADRAFVVIAWVPVLVFAGLDTYYLWRERLYRRLHGKVAAKPDDAPADFSMDTAEFRAAETWPRALASKTILGFYLP